MKIAIGCDHAGYPYKEVIIKFLEKNGYEVIDHGTDSTESVDYPDFVHPVASMVEAGEAERGVLICGTGNGVCMTANKHTGVRAGLSWKRDIASLIRQHNDANIICIPARFVSRRLAVDMVKIFISTEFEGGRHQRRVNKISC